LQVGLDWNPLGKPKPGFEAEFYALLGQLTKVESWLQPSPVSHALISAGTDSNALRQRLFDIQISPYETLGSPQVGRDPEADAWIKSKYETAPNKPASIDEWVRQFQGYYAVALLPDNDGLPVYSNSALSGPWERWSFRAKFLDDCRNVLGDGLFYEAWFHHAPAQLADYGVRLMNCASVYAAANDVSHVLHMRSLDEADALRAKETSSPLHKAHIIASAARWATYWSLRGHGQEADY